MEMEAMVDHSEVYSQETEFKIVEVCSVDNSHFGASNSVSEVVVDYESDSNILVVDHDFGYGASQSNSAEMHFQPVKKRRRRQTETLICPVCGKICMSISGLKVHQKIHLRDTSLDCNICNMTFASQAAQSAHMTIHNPEKTHQCPCCPLRFASDRALQGHFRVHHKGFEMMLSQKKQEQQQQQQQQTSQSPPARKKSKKLDPLPPSGHFSELPPGEYFSQSPPSRQHSQSPPVSVKQKGKKTHKTPMLLELPEPQPEIVSLQLIESQKSKSKGLYRNKEKIKMSKLNRKAFLQATPVQQASFLQQVIEESKRPVPAQTANTKSDRNGVYRCNICKKIFRELHFLEKHIVVHMSVRHHKCNTCDESFDSARALNAHENEHDQGQYICSICGKNLHKLGSLLNHQLLHEKKGAKFKAKAKTKAKTKSRK